MCNREKSRRFRAEEDRLKLTVFGTVTDYNKEFYWSKYYNVLLVVVVVNQESMVFRKPSNETYQNDPHPFIQVPKQFCKLLKFETIKTFNEG